MRKERSRDRFGAENFFWWKICFSQIQKVSRARRMDISRRGGLSGVTTDTRKVNQTNSS